METTSASEVEPAVEQPGLSRLREVVANYLPPVPSGAAMRRDALAGLSSALGSAPDGMANGILAGTNPVYGLYGSMTGAAVAGVFSSTQLMVVTSTSAAALAANQALPALPAARRDEALFLMVMLIGVAQMVFGFLRLGRLVRFVSYSVMTGFLIGVAMLMILSQIPTVTGVAAEGDNKVAETLSVIANIGQADAATLLLALLTLALVVTLPRTPLGNVGPLAAVAVPSALVALLGLESVAVVSDVGDVSGGFPELFIPSLSSVTPEVVTGALAVAAITLVQGAGVSQSVPNPDGSRTSVSRDFVAQGAANVAAGLLRGLPVGGSLSSTALSLVAGPRSRWAAIFTGLWLAAFVIIFPTVISYVAMPALGALLIHAGADTIKPSEVIAIWSAGWRSRLACVTTFLSTLLLPIQAAVGIGVVLSALLYVNESSTDVTVVELLRGPGGRIRERRAPKRLASNEITVLEVYGHLFFAGARTLERVLPRARGTRNPVVILRLRGRNSVGATLVEVLAQYADSLRQANGRLFLTGVSEYVYDQMVLSRKLPLGGTVQVYKATPLRGESTEAAREDARRWLEELRANERGGSDSSGGGGGEGA